MASDPYSAIRGSSRITFPVLVSVVTRRTTLFHGVEDSASPLFPRKRPVVDATTIFGNTSQSAEA